MMYEYGESWWNDIDRRKKNSVKNLPQSHFVNHKSRMDSPGFEAKVDLKEMRWRAWI
jgi:hypothetical protein